MREKALNECLKVFTSRRRRSDFSNEAASVETLETKNSNEDYCVSASVCTCVDFFFFPSTGPEFLVPVFRVSVNAKKEIYIYIYNVRKKSSRLPREENTPSFVVPFIPFIRDCVKENVIEARLFQTFCPLLFLAKRACSLNIPHWIGHYYDAQSLRTQRSVRAYYPVANGKAVFTTALCTSPRCQGTVLSRRGLSALACGLWPGIH